MGSKTALLSGNLGSILLAEAAEAHRFVDLFAGSGAVAHYMAQNTRLPVLSVDLQEYARVFAAAITERTSSLVAGSVLSDWTSVERIDTTPIRKRALSKTAVKAARREASSADEGFITRHYGGHYFSLSQARTLDRLYESLPTVEPERTVALAALLQAASVCAAAPGHTAQPFQPTASLLPYIDQAWSRDVTAAATSAVDQLAPAHAAVKGEARVGDAQSTAKRLRKGDLVFCDPPYSAVQYSRFYHVLEGIARGGWDEVSGHGRAPARSSRASSDFSMKTKAPGAMKALLDALREQGCRVIITFPNADASNGLSGQDIIAIASEAWRVEPHYVDAVHSTLGGSSESTGRGGRRKLKEAVIVLTPKTLSVNVPIVLPVPVDAVETVKTTEQISA